MPLYEIKMYATKTFYVDADSQQEALNEEAVEDERDFFDGQVDWEHCETEAVLVHKQTESHIREVCPKLILD